MNIFSCNIFRIVESLNICTEGQQAYWSVVSERYFFFENGCRGGEAREGEGLTQRCSGETGLISIELFLYSDPICCAGYGGHFEGHGHQ